MQQYIPNVKAYVIHVSLHKYKNVYFQIKLCVCLYRPIVHYDMYCKPK